MKKIFLFFCLILLFLHMLMLFFYNIPENFSNISISRISEKYTKTLFNQQWALFTPVPKIKIDLWYVSKDSFFLNNPMRTKESFIYNSILFFYSAPKPFSSINDSVFNFNKNVFIKRSLWYAIKHDASINESQKDSGKIVLIETHYSCPGILEKTERVCYE